MELWPISTAIVITVMDVSHGTIQCYLEVEQVEFQIAVFMGFLCKNVQKSKKNLDFVVKDLVEVLKRHRFVTLWRSDC